MAEMSMNKAIHGAVRRDLDRFVGALSTFRDGDAARAQQLANAWENFDDQLTFHHEGEHEIAWPHLERIGVSRELLDRMDDEHEAMASALDQARVAIRTLASSAGSAEAGRALSAVERLRDVTIEHLDHEEREIEPVYLANEGHPEMQAMGRKFAKGSPVRAGRFFAWILDGASPQERETVTGSVPGPVLAVLSGLFGRGYRNNVAPVWRA